MLFRTRSYPLTFFVYQIRRKWLAGLRIAFPDAKKCRRDPGLHFLMPKNAVGTPDCIS